MSERFKIQWGLNPGGSKFWRVTGMKNDGTRVRQNYNDEALAIAARNALDLEAVNAAPVVRTLALMTEDQAREAESVFRMLAGSKLTMTKAVRFALDNYRETAKTATILQAAESFLHAKRIANKRSDTVRNLQGRLYQLKQQHGAKLVHEIHADDLRPLIHRENSSTLNQRNDRVALFNFFKWTVKEHYRAANPVAEIDEIEWEVGDVRTFTPKQVADVMLAAENYREGRLVPFFALAIFAAVRVKEVKRGMVSDVNLRAGTVRVGAKGAKTRSRRIVKLPANCIAFLEAYLPTENRETTPIVPPNFRRDFDAVREAAGLTEWPQDIMRHTGITVELVMSKDESATALWAGNSPKVIHESYKGLDIEEPEAKAILAVMPTKQRPTNIVQAALAQAA